MKQRPVIQKQTRITSLFFIKKFTFNKILPLKAGTPNTILNLKN